MAKGQIKKAKTNTPKLSTKEKQQKKKEKAWKKLEEKQKKGGEKPGEKDKDKDKEDGQGDKPEGGIEGLLPKEIELVHGPGCPVCVLPMGRVDDCVAIAERPGVIFTTASATK